MRHALAVAALPFALALAGCAGWQANKGSQAVDINPFAAGTGEPVIRPSNGPGFMDGQPQDMRTR
jgi:hypothetical protein